MNERFSKAALLRYAQERMNFAATVLSKNR